MQLYSYFRPCGQYSLRNLLFTQLSWTTVPWTNCTFQNWVFKLLSKIEMYWRLLLSTFYLRWPLYESQISITQNKCDDDIIFINLENFDHIVASYSKTTRHVHFWTHTGACMRTSWTLGCKMKYRLTMWSCIRQTRIFKRVNSTQLSLNVWT